MFLWLIFPWLKSTKRQTDLTRPDPNWSWTTLLQSASKLHIYKYAILLQPFEVKTNSFHEKYSENSHNCNGWYTIRSSRTCCRCSSCYSGGVTCCLITRSSRASCCSGGTACRYLSCCKVLQFQKHLPMFLFIKTRVNIVFIKISIKCK